MNHVETFQSRCLAGVARRDITPPVGIYHRMWGAATHDRSTGVHRPLTTTVLSLRNVTDQFADPLIAIAVDHCLLWPKEMQRILNYVSEKTGEPRGSLMVCFSHTHAAGLMGLERRHLPGGELIEPYLEEFASQIADAVTEAQRRQVPASIVYGRGDCGLATNRDYFDKQNSRYVCGYNPVGKADSTVIVGRVLNDACETMASVVNYACHPTTLAWDNTLISPDYVGAMREVVEQATNAPCVFIQGASGDIGPREGFVGNTAVADRNGRQLGYAVLSVLESMGQPGMTFQYAGPVISGATIGTWRFEKTPADRSRQLENWRRVQVVVPLPYRDGLMHQGELDQEKRQWQAAEQKALAANDHVAARNARAMIERVDRTFLRVESLPAGPFYPFPIDAWRTGDAIWIALDGEHYNLLQRTLRERFPNVSLVIGTIVNGSNTWYLLDQSSYHLGLYQEDVSVLAPGALETLIEAATSVIQGLLDG